MYNCQSFAGDAWPTSPVPATSIPIGNPTGITLDPAGNLYIAGPSIVFEMDPSGMLTRIAGNGHNGYSGGGGPATNALLGFPRGFGASGSISPDLMTEITEFGGGNPLLNLSAEDWISDFRKATGQ